MTETKEPKEKKTIMEIENVRIREYDTYNLQVERFETYYNPKTKEDIQGWRFKGYSSSILDALKMIARKDLLIDPNTVSDLKSYLNEVLESHENLISRLDVNVNE